MAMVANNPKAAKRVGIAESDGAVGAIAKRRRVASIREDVVGKTVRAGRHLTARKASVAGAQENCVACGIANVSAAHTLLDMN